MNISEKFDLKKYNEWYNKTFHVNIELVKEVEELRNNLSKELFQAIKNDREETTVWDMLLTLINDISIQVQSENENFSFDVLPETIVNNPSQLRELIIKPTHSIINKMWRMNNFQRGMDYISLDNVNVKMKDLIRFSIRTNSLKSSELLAQYLIEHLKSGHGEDYSIYWNKILESVEVNSEMKTSTGYFAYHIYFRLKIGVTVEMQIYSILSDSWKKLSHKIYEAVRDEINVRYNFNDVHSRIISIGHLLYLADCELYNLEEELKREKEPK